MKIVIYFSALFGLFWLIHGALSHRDPGVKRNSIKHVNAKEDRREYSSFESSSGQDKVLIRSESPLRGRKIHQTAWSKEETDGENDQVTKPDRKEDTGLESSWTLEKILKYLTSLVYSTEDTEQPGHILITSEVIRDGTEAKSKTKNKQKSTKKNHGEISKNTQKHGMEEYSTYKMSYLEDYYENLQTEKDMGYESDESYEISYEYGNEDRINYKRNSKIVRNKFNHRFQDKGRKIMKTDQNSSSEDDEDCSEDTDIKFKQNSGEIDMLLKKVISKNNDMKQSDEETNFKQETISNKNYKGIKNILRGKTEKGVIQTKKHSPKIIILNGTVTGQNNKNKENGDSLQTNIQRKKSQVESSNTVNKVNENISKETNIDEHQNIQIDSYVNQEMIQNTNHKNIVQNTSFSQTEKDDITDTIIEHSTLNNHDNLQENTKTSSVIRSKGNKQQDSKNTFIENKQTHSRNDESIKNEVGNIENMQNEEMLITTNNSENVEENTKTSFIMKSKLNKEIENNNFIETIQSVSRNDENLKNTIWKTENMQNEETLITTSSNNPEKQSFDEKNIILETQPEIVTFETKQKSIQAINEETVNNPVQMQTILINTELKNGEKKEFDIQNRTQKISETQTEGKYEKMTENYDKFSQHQASQIFVIENNQQNYEAKNFNDQIKETHLISKDDNGYEYVLEGNEFVPLNSYNEAKHKGYNNAVNNKASENKSQLLTESIVQILQNVNQADNEQQETFDTILEFLYKHSKNPLILSLKENGNDTFKNR